MISHTVIFKSLILAHVTGLLKVMPLKAGPVNLKSKRIEMKVNQKSHPGLLLIPVLKQLYCSLIFLRLESRRAGVNVN